MASGKRPADQQVEGRKRQKISLACDQCRARKSKCDGDKPICGECANRGNQPHHCRYRLHGHPRAEHERYVESLLLRIKDLEQRDSNGALNNPAARAPYPERQSKTFPEASKPLASGTAPSAVSYETFLPQQEASEMSPIDGMGADQTSEPQLQRSNDKYYGSSSAASFMLDVYKTVWTDSEPTSGGAISTKSTPARDKNKTNIFRELCQPSLLPRPLMDQAMNCYWDQVHHLYPFVHRPTFSRAYEQLWSSSPPSDALEEDGAGLGGLQAHGSRSILFHCALNCMLAIATQFLDVSSEERERMGTHFSSTARSLCHLDLFDDGSLAAIQTAMLMTQFLQATNFPNRCWTSIGIACRLALGLGLHLNNEAKCSLLEVEMRRRVWHGCVLLDTVVSMTLGRPLMLHPYRDVPYPDGADDDILGGGPGPTSTNISPIQFFVETLKLYELMADIITHVYHKPGGPANSEAGSNITVGVDYVLDIERRLSTFENDLPDQLHWDRRLKLPRNMQQEAPFEQQSSVLYVRYLYLKVLLHRAIFTRYCQTARQKNWNLQDHDTDDTSDAIARALSIACVRNATQLIAQVYQRSATKATGAWWYNVFYLRVAGIVVLLAMISHNITDVLGEAYLNMAWQNCQQALSALETSSTTAGSCLNGLRKLHHHVQEHSAPSAKQDILIISESVSATTAERAKSDAAQSSNHLEFNNSDSSKQQEQSQPSWIDSNDFGWSSLLDNSPFDDIWAYDFGRDMPSDETFFEPV